MKAAIIFYSTLLLSTLLFAPGTQASNNTNSIGIQFKNIPAGNFFMGSCFLSRADKERDRLRKKEGLAPLGAICPAKVPIDNDGMDEETPQHLVQISRGFQLSIHEVTLGQFKQFLDSLSDEKRNLIDNDEFKKFNAHGDDAPVTMVSWNNVQDFISWLNVKEQGAHYRLPTEAEWEYAARAGSKTIYSWGDDIGQAGQYAWFNIKHGDINTSLNKDDQGKRENFAHPVGQKQPNKWGLYDMQGNVWEWVQDKYGMDFYSISPNVDPQGAKTGRTRVFRGGSWYSNISGIRSAFRGANAQTYRSNSLGFRLAR